MENKNDNPSSISIFALAIGLIITVVGVLLMIFEVSGELVSFIKKSPVAFGIIVLLIFYIVLVNKK